jgi:hypothetical protein
MVKLENVYSKLNELKFFDRSREVIYNTYKIKFDFNLDILKKDIKTIYDKMMANKTYFKPSNQFGILKSKYGVKSEKDNISSLGNKDHVKYIVMVELAILNNKDLNDFDIPEEIKEIYGINKNDKYSKDNLIRYINEQEMSEELKSELITLIESIETSYRDVKFNKLMNYSDNVLKAIYNWDCLFDPTISKNYNHYKDRILNCKLDKHMIVSLINDTNQVDEKDFINQFIAANNF